MSQLNTVALSKARRSLVAVEKVGDRLEETGQDIQYIKNDSRDYSHYTSQNEAPVICVAKRSSNFLIPSQEGSLYTEVLWNIEDIDSDDLHANTGADSSKMKIKEEGIYRLEVSVNITAGEAGTREVMLVKGNTTIEKAKATASSGEEVTFQLNTTNIAKSGDFYTVRVRQNSGADLHVTPSISKFTLVKIGTPVGVRGDITFDSAFGFRGLSQYAATILPERINIESDPVLGAKRQVASFHTRKQDNEVYYPRVQVNTASNLSANSEFYVGFSVYVPNDFEFIEGLAGEILLHEIYGPPFNSTGPNTFKIFNSDFAMHTFIGGELLPVWTMPVVRGKWFDFVFKYKMSKDPAVGYVELWVDQGEGLTKQTVNGLDKFFYATLKEGTNDSGNNYSCLKVAFGYDNQGPRQEAIIKFASHRLGKTLDAVNPNSYLSIP